MTATVKAHCNWTQTAGKELSQLVPTRLSEEDVFTKPPLDDVVNADRAALFNNDSFSANCELSFSISPRYKIAALTLVCSAAKVELFLGVSQEYSETVYGLALEEDDADPRPYRYDMEIDRSGIADINLKLLTSSKEICVYGVMLHIAPNPNGITTQLPRPVDMQKIQELLQKGGGASGKSEEQAQKFHQFMSLMSGCTSRNHGEEPSPESSLDVNSLRAHIDSKFEQLEQRLVKRLNDLQIQQEEKLSLILELLEKQN